mmetsp:Transcript_1506/g.2160  ORF Transcript_1506/g.2160 Transcript_1506/m.2160 type:complete len:109 (+) Transcript_1506:1520-1846(+)
MRMTTIPLQQKNVNINPQTPATKCRRIYPCPNSRQEVTPQRRLKMHTSIFLIITKGRAGTLLDGGLRKDKKQLIHHQNFWQSHANFKITSFATQSKSLLLNEKIIFKS